MRWVLRNSIRILPSAIPIVFLMIALSVFYSQNHATLSLEGEMSLTSDVEMADNYPTRVTEDDEQEKTDKPRTQPISATLIAKNYVFTRRSGLSFFGRGHSALFVAQIPEFLDRSSFPQRLNQQLRQEYEQAAVEFTAMDWSLVLDGLRDPQPYLQHWEGSIGIDVVHLSTQSASVLEFHWEYTGGAHGNTVITGRCFVDTDGKITQLELADLFDPSSDWARRLIAYCLKDLHSQGASHVSDVVVEDPESTTYTVDNLTSFTLSPAGITFFFSPYQVGCYAEGIYTVRVPYDAIRDCLPDYSPARLFMSIGNR